jgi:threonine synthase
LKRFNGVVEQATESELAEAAARADLTGMFNDPHTGVALAVLEKLVHNGTIQPDQRTVVISTANGLKFTDFKVRYHDSQLGEYGIQSRHANRPVELPARFDDVKHAVESAVGSAIGSPA